MNVCAERGAGGSSWATVTGLGADHHRTLPADRPDRSGTTSETWPVPSWVGEAHPPLDRDEVRVWLVSLDRVGEATHLEALLATDERARADRFRFARDRNRFIACRGVCRLLLGRTLGSHPATLRFRTGPAGKPALVGDYATEGLRFNVTHAGGFALIALARDREVGVDLEWIRPDFDYPPVATWFTPGEQQALAATVAERRRTAFYAMWTLKEAYAKALGRGLSLPLDQFEVVFPPAEHAVTLAHPVPHDGDPATPSRWNLRTLNLGPDYAGALAVERRDRDWHQTTWRWPNDASDERPSGS